MGVGTPRSVAVAAPSKAKLQLWPVLSTNLGPQHSRPIVDVLSQTQSPKLLVYINSGLQPQLTSLAALDDQQFWFCDGAYSMDHEGYDPDLRIFRAAAAAFDSAAPATDLGMPTLIPLPHDVPCTGTNDQRREPASQKVVFDFLASYCSWDLDSIYCRGWQATLSSSA